MNVTVRDIKAHRSLEATTDEKSADFLVDMASSFAPYMEYNIDYDCSIILPNEAVQLDIKFVKRKAA
jgi:hypothetical protein